MVEPRAIIGLLLLSVCAPRTGNVETITAHGGSVDDSRPLPFTTPKYSHFTGPCSAAGSSSEGEELVLAFEYDQMGRLIRVDTILTEATDGTQEWRETWRYEGEHLVAHELWLTWNDEILVSGPSDSGPVWNCYREGTGPYPRRETWEYDDAGHVVGWEITGWGAEPLLECVPSRGERYDWATGTVESWTRSWADFVELMPIVSCFDVAKGSWRSDDVGCDANTLQGQAEAWSKRATAIFAGELPANTVTATYRRDESGSFTWTGATATPAGRLTVAENGLLRSLESDGCGLEWVWTFDEAGRPIEQRVNERSWFYDWARQGLLRMRDRERETAKMGQTIEFDERGRLLRHLGDWSIEFDYSCNTAGTTLANPGLTLTVLDDLAASTRAQGFVIPRPQLIYDGYDPGLPLAAPGLWGSGRGIHGALEPGGRYWMSGGCPDELGPWYGGRVACDLPSGCESDDK